MALVLSIGALGLGCWSTTQSLTTAQASSGETGFGAAAHDHWFFAVLAAARTRYIATGNVAMVSAAPGAGLSKESVWQAYDGGRRIRHCFVPDRGGPVCAEAELPERLGWGKSAVFIDPANLGSFVTEVRATVTSGDTTYRYRSVSGSTRAGDIRTNAGPTHGVWVQVVGQQALLHCQIERDARPRCRAHAPDVDTFFIKTTILDTVLGVSTIGEEDVLWLSKLGGVFRCTASPSRPKPTCQAAEIR